ncbi:MAG: gyrase subunit, partial [Verrucomicrobiota bacterium]|nr:gyrase subunit [Verrucomicrobiota bacterium]
GREFTKEQLGEVLDLLEKLSKLSDSIRRHGGDFEEYLSNREPVSGKLPEYLVKVREGNNEYVKYFHDEAPLRDFASQNLDLNLYEEEPVGENGDGALPPINGNGAPPVASYMRRRARRVELHESNSVAKVFQELENRGMTIDHYSASDQPLFELIEGEGERTTVTPLFSIPKILEAIKEIGRRGVQIKRFKGLGEMNAKELFSTTMDPVRRKLLRVDLNENNASEADKMFTILMGDVVEPRRAFIEDNALNVRNLDV